ncbi:hypothetical protein [Sutcliffiella rhizosphaerae]|uniref:hypothetical protein n=1 Tax=Sutcliffiella rhizosphaerae TaxID=2880967 RepID=UPI001E4D783B|nr:hypothetical protein [Sutcliffiella rhizosphaerae]
MELVRCKRKGIGWLLDNQYQYGQYKEFINTLLPYLFKIPTLYAKMPPGFREATEKVQYLIKAVESSI